jgi:hypothetical protein
MKPFLARLICHTSFTCWCYILACSVLSLFCAWLLPCPFPSDVPGQHRRAFVTNMQVPVLIVSINAFVRCLDQDSVTDFLRAATLQPRGPSPFLDCNYSGPPFCCLIRRSGHLMPSHPFCPSNDTCFSALPMTLAVEQHYDPHATATSPPRPPGSPLSHDISGIDPQVNLYGRGQVASPVHSEFRVISSLSSGQHPPRC